jgi:hypothetical protein
VPWTLCANGLWGVCRHGLRDCRISHPSLGTAAPKATDSDCDRGRVSPSHFPKFPAASWLQLVRAVTIRLVSVLENFSLLNPCACGQVGRGRRLRGTASVTPSPYSSEVAPLQFAGRRCNHGPMALEGGRRRPMALARRTPSYRT